jgi:hypothetical protein
MFHGAKDHGFLPSNLIELPGGLFSAQSPPGRCGIKKVDGHDLSRFLA